MKVGELMSTPVVTCHEDDTLGAVAVMMSDNDCGALPVVDKDGVVLGMITDRDMVLAAASTGRPLDDIHVAEVINGNVFAVTPADSLKAAERMMREQKVRRLPVVDDDDRVVGLLSINDLAREAHRQRRRKRKAINSNDIAETLAAICEPCEPKTRDLGVAL